MFLVRAIELYDSAFIQCARYVPKPTTTHTPPESSQPHTTLPTDNGYAVRTHQGEKGGVPTSYRTTYILVAS